MDYIKIKKNKLNKLLKKINYIIKNTPMPNNWADEMHLDDLLLYRSEIQDNIKEHHILLLVYNNTKLIKEELIEKSINILYRPLHVNT